MTPRKEVLWFAERMERKLALHDDRDHWTTSDPAFLMTRLLEEVRELDDAMMGTGFDYRPMIKEEQDRVIDEAADVANFAMMIADIARQSLIKKPLRCETSVKCEDCSKFAACRRFRGEEDCLNFVAISDYASRKAEFCRSCAHETAAKARAGIIERLEARISELEEQLEDETLLCRGQRARIHELEAEVEACRALLDEKQEAK